MKTRHGYVSNSSSSSFVVLGRHVTTESAKVLCMFSGRVIGYVCGGGHSGECGDDVIEMTPEHLFWLEKECIQMPLFRVDDIIQAYDDSDVSVAASIEPKFSDSELLFLHRDYSCTKTFDEFRTSYSSCRLFASCSGFVLLPVCGLSYQDACDSFCAGTALYLFDNLENALVRLSDVEFDCLNSLSEFHDNFGLRYHLYDRVFISDGPLPCEFKEPVLVFPKICLERPIELLSAF